MKTKLKLSPELNKFLLRHGVKRKFVKNIKIPPTTLTVSTISEAFVWDDSPEGFKFWSKLYNQSKL